MFRASITKSKFSLLLILDSYRELQFILVYKDKRKEVVIVKTLDIEFIKSIGNCK